jgi:hypothetical protein
MSSTQPTLSSYHGVPPLAGLCGFPDAAKPGLSVENCVQRLRRFHYSLKRLHGILVARITAEPVYELKSAFSLHAYLCSEHVLALATRVGEMRQPPLHLDKVPDANLELFFDEIAAAETTGELLIGLYEKAVPALEQAMRRYVAQTNLLADAPSVRVLRFALLELADMFEFGRGAIGRLVDEAARQKMAPWLKVLDSALAAAGELDGAAAPAKPPQRMRSLKPYQYDPVPKRDERFRDLFNQGVNAEEFLHDPEMPADAKSLMLMFKRLREIDVPEMMASILVQTTGQPWEYYRDMTRQMWDEARHALMGEVGFVALGVDWTRARLTHNWSLRLNTECTPLERHAVLYFIEQGLMGKTGKRYEWEVGVESGIPLAGTFQDFDWADEVLHAQIGRAWLFPQIGSRAKAIEYGDKTWSRILSNWAEVRDKGLTKHENWWPDVYRAACRAWGKTPDPRALEYDTTYEGGRADLKPVSG